jgi:hypothetical protein
MVFLNNALFMNTPDIRWQQRFTNYNKALMQLKNAVELSKAAPFVSTGEARRYSGI